MSAMRTINFVLLVARASISLMFLENVRNALMLLVLVARHAQSQSAPKSPTMQNSSFVAPRLLLLPKNVPQSVRIFSLVANQNHARQKHATSAVVILFFKTDSARSMITFVQLDSYL